MDFYGYINTVDRIDEDLIQSVEYNVFVERMSALLNKLKLHYSFEK